MISILAIVAVATALEAEIERPTPPATSAPYAVQCDHETAIVAGEPIPDGLVVDGVVQCSAVLVPTSRAADLLLWENYARRLETYADWQSDRWSLDVAQRDRDLLWCRARIEQLEQPPRWFATPAAYKWGARAEMLAITGMVVAVFAVGYGVSNAGSG